MFHNYYEVVRGQHCYDACKQIQKDNVYIMPRVHMFFLCVSLFSRFVCTCFCNYFIRWPVPYPAATLPNDYR